MNRTSREIPTGPIGKNVEFQRERKIGGERGFVGRWVKWTVDKGGDSRGGKVIGTDIVRELLPEFAAGREGKLVAQHDLVFDDTLRESDLAIETIERAVEKGWDVRVNYIQRPIDLVIKGAIDRAERSGRWGSVAALPGIHQAVQQSMLSIAKHFDGSTNVRIALWLNDGETIGTPPKKLTLAQIDKGGEYSYDQIHENSGTTGQGRSERPGDSQRFRSESVERTTRKGTEGTDYESAGRASVVRRFREALASGRYSPEVLKLLAQGDPELEGYVEDAFRENDVKDGEGS